MLVAQAIADLVLIKLLVKFKNIDPKIYGQKWSKRSKTVKMFKNGKNPDLAVQCLFDPDSVQLPNFQKHLQKRHNRNRSKFHCHSIYYRSYIYAHFYTFVAEKVIAREFWN